MRTSTISGSTAMEVQFIKVNPLTRLALDEEVGKAARELVQQLIVERRPGSPRGRYADRGSLAAPIRRKDSLTALTWSLAKDYADLEQTKALARALDVDLTLHAPYYVDFFGSTEARRAVDPSDPVGWGARRRPGGPPRGHSPRVLRTGDRSDSIQELTEIVTDLSGWFSKFTKGRSGSPSSRAATRTCSVRGRRCSSWPTAREGDRAGAQSPAHRRPRADRPSKNRTTLARSSMSS